MKVKKYLSVIVVLLMFLSGLPTISVPASFPSPWVKVFVDQPLGYIPSVAPGTHFRIDIMIVTSGFVDFGSPSIVGWKLDLQVNPDVISINTTAPPPPPFPPPPPDARVIGSKPGYVMYDFNPPDPYPILSELDPGEANATSGYWDDISEVLMPLPSGGIGDYMTNVFYGGPAKLITFEVTSKSDTQGCLIDLIDVEWLDASNVWHLVDIVVDGYYGTPPAGPHYMSENTGTYNPTQNPVGTMWHELYPDYCYMWEIISWTDNGDGSLSSSDQIEMLNETGWIYPYHVDAVTTTIHWTFKDSPFTDELADAEPQEPSLIPGILGDPVGSYWHEIYPEYCKRFKITDWIDNGDGEFGPSDQFQILYEEGFSAPPSPPPGPGPYWAHLDKITTDIIISQKDDPWPGPAPDLSIEGILLPYMVIYYPLIYPNPPLEFGYKINATVTNLGTADAGSFSVSFSAYLGGWFSWRMVTVFGLGVGETENVSFYFFPEDYGTYTLVIEADCYNDVAELDETNNVKTTWVIGTIRGDVDGDGDVDRYDFGYFASAYGRIFEQPPYDPADFDYDGDVDRNDFGTLASNYGKTAV